MERLSPKAVIFDLGSTLIEYEKVPWPELGRHCNASGWRFLKEQGLEIPDEEPFNQAFEATKAAYRRIAEETMQEWTVPQVAREFFAKLGLQDSDGLERAFFEAYYQPVAKQIFVFDDALETLKRVRERFGMIGLVSNTIFPEETHRRELKRFGIEPLLDFAVFSSTFKLRKPHPDIFYKAANLAGVAPSECVYVGDRFREDVEGPAAIGMNAVLKVLSGREYPEDMPKWVRKIKTLSELEQHLDI